ncbi:MAG TPA: FG-GAP-like repeat-containing protein [Gaiellaceae bacterium]|nr:FG-GAP-like repeat-containing protein [Gaiellaceae bacterium]
MWRSWVAIGATALIAILVGVFLLRSGDDETAAAPGPDRGAARPAAVRLQDVAAERGLDFRHGAFRFGPSADPAAMTGGGVCWIDYDGDGWLDLFVVNGYAQSDRAAWLRAGGLPTTRLYRNVDGRFTDVTRETGAGLAVRGQGCVAADLDADGHTDLFVTTAEFSRLLWNDGDGGFREGSEDAGVAAFGWHTGAASGDVNGDGRPDLVVTGYVDLNKPVEGAAQGFPGTYKGTRDLLYLNEGGRRFREVGEDAGLEVVGFEYGLGVLLSDFERDGDLDVYVANDTNPDRLYENVPWPGGAAADPAGLGFRFEERAARAGVADPGSGMGVAEADFDGDGRSDLFVTNARQQRHGVFRSKPPDENDPSFLDVRSEIGPNLGRATGWGVSWGDLDLDTDADLVLVNGKVPVTSLLADREPAQAFTNLAAQGRPGRFTDSSRAMLGGVGALLARSSAEADYDNDGDLDVAVGTVGGPLALLENTASTGNWLEVAIDGFRPGAEVTLSLPDGKRLRRELRAGGSYLSSEDPRLHFGLGAAQRVRELVIRWPGGGETRRTGVAANQVVAVEAPQPRVRRSATADTWTIAGCTPRHEGQSVARVWDEALLDAIRRDVPAPTVHARNLFHVSAAMWDAWAAYDRKADGYFVDEKLQADDVPAAREAAISYAAYRILLHRYSLAASLQETFDELERTMRSLCYRPGYTAQDGTAPAALGNRIAAAVIAQGREDGSLEAQHYVDPAYKAVNPPLVVKQPGAPLHDPNRWQPLALDTQIAQNGLPLPSRVQRFVGPHWGHVRPFALPPSASGLPIDPGKPPQFGTRAYVDMALAVLRRSSELDPRDRISIDVGPHARGGNHLGTNDGHGHRVNPVTGKPYAPDRMLRGDFARALTEFWADGPDSETPPGHWNTVANAVSDAPGVVRGDRLEWDVKLYFALNGAVHDAAVAAWGAKGHYDSVRPISMIRYLGAKNLLPSVPGLVERLGGKTFVRAWKEGGVGWQPAERWVPYQLSTFVTPAFAGFVSGHSTFSRAAAEVLTGVTGSPYFPGGVFELKVPRGHLKVEPGPSRPLTLRWATYYDAADDAGISRLYGGIHVPADDFAGRRAGAQCGKEALALARRYFDGTARP